MRGQDVHLEGAFLDVQTETGFLEGLELIRDAAFANYSDKKHIERVVNTNSVGCGSKISRTRWGCCVFTHQAGDVVFSHINQKQNTTHNVNALL